MMQKNQTRSSLIIILKGLLPVCVIWFICLACYDAFADSFVPITSQLVKPSETKTVSLNAEPSLGQISEATRFSGSTEVAVRSASKSIKDIKVGTVIASFGVKDASKRVVSLSHGVSNDLVLVMTVERDRIEATHDAQFWVSKKGWVKAGALFPGEKLMSRNGRLIEIFNIRPESLGKAEVFGLHLESDANYYVGKSAVMVKGV